MKTIFSNSATELNQKILSDFREFKDINEFTYCSLHQETKHTHCSIVRFSTTIRYGGDDLDKSPIYRDFNHFCQDNSEDYCFVSKTTCQDNIHIGEFSVERMYVVK